MFELWQPTTNVLVAVSIIALQPPLLSYTGLSESTEIDVSPLQSKKALVPMEVTELGIVMDVSPLQWLKALKPMEVTELGIETEVSPLQS